MKDQDEFLKQMENLQVPEIDPREHQKTIKMTIMNAERSAALGVWLIVVPCYFLLCVFMYYFFHIHIGWFGAMFKMMEGLEKTLYIDFLGPLILVLLPIVCIIINALAIIHTNVQKHSLGPNSVKEFNITIKIKTWNILLILISLALVCTFIAYVITENISIKN
jgi:hypothetical protein